MLQLTSETIDIIGICAREVAMINDMQARSKQKMTGGG